MYLWATIYVYTFLAALQLNAVSHLAFSHFLAPKVALECMKICSRNKIGFALLFFFLLQSLEKFQRQLAEAEEAAYGQQRGEGSRGGWRRGQNKSKEGRKRRDEDRDGLDRARASSPAGRDGQRAWRREERDEHRGRSPARERLRGRDRERESDKERNRNRERDSLRSRFLKPSDDDGAEGESENSSTQFPDGSCSQHISVTQLWSVRHLGRRQPS